MGTDYDFKGDATKLACSYDALATSVSPGQTILCADGSLCLTVLSCDVGKGEVSCKIENDAEIGERKNMNLPGVHVDLPTCTEKDVNEIENLEGMENYDEILKETDGIMVARGDLGMEIPPEKVFLAQKMMIRAANIAGKPVVTATQMFESMIHNPRPTRAEASDVSNAVLDGSDCVMLSGETANGEHPVNAVAIMARTCTEAESIVNFNGLYEAVRNSTILAYGKLDTAESIASSAVKTSIDIGAKVIIVCSQSGKTARLIAKYRPAAKICVLTPHSIVSRQSCGVLKGVYTFISCLTDTDACIKDAKEKILFSGDVEKGEGVVIVYGMSANVGSTNTLKIDYF